MTHIDLENYPQIRAAAEQRRRDEQRYARWQEWANKVGRQNEERTAKYRAALQAAEEAGEMPPTKPELLECGPPPFDLQTRRADWQRERQEAMVAHADEIRRDISAELARTEKQAKPLREKLAEIDAHIHDLAELRHKVNVTVQHAGSTVNPAVPRQVSPPEQRAALGPVTHGTIQVM